MQGECRLVGALVLVGNAPPSGEQIRLHGEKCRCGPPLLPAGNRGTPPVIGILAAFGYGQVPIHRP